VKQNTVNIAGQLFFVRIHTVVCANFECVTYSIDRNSSACPLMCVIGMRDGSGGYSPVSHRGDPGSVPCQSMWDFMVDKVALRQFFLRSTAVLSCHFQYHASLCGIYGGQSGTETVF
jgi:hypothetical protein